MLGNERGRTKLTHHEGSQGAISIRSVACALVLLMLLIAPSAPAFAQCVGTRYVAGQGFDGGNLCGDPDQPCALLSHAVAVACAGETVLVAPADYVDDVVIDKPLTIRGTGPILQTHIQGTGGSPVVRVLSGDVWFGGITLWRTPGVPLLQIGDGAHTGLRGITIENTTLRESTLGIVIDSTGWAADAAWNRLAGVIVRDMNADGSAWGGAGIVLTGGNGKLQLVAGRVHHDQGGGIVLLPPPEGAVNRQLVISGYFIYANGQSAGGPSAAGVELSDVSDVMIEGNEFYEQTGVGGDDGRALILDRVDGVTVTCNRMHDNDGGLVLRGASRAVTVGYNEFQAQTAGAAIEVAAGAAEQLSITRNLIHGNLDGIRYDGATPLAVPENWFGANDGPAPIGSGDPLVGALDGAGFIAHGTAPLLVRRPEASGWSFPQAACRDRLQEAIDAAPDGSIVLAGAGEYYEHLTITRPLRLWGETGASGCSRAVVHGYQDPQAVRPVIAVTSTDHVTLTDLTVRSAAQGLPCGSTDPQQVGIALTDVSDSTLQRLCLIENGVSELRLFGASHRNRLLDLSIDGMTRDQFGQDVCGHRSREAISIVGDPVCSGGDGAVPTGNRIERLSAQRVAQGVALELAAGTTIEASTIDAEPAAAWGGGSLAIGVRAAPAAETSITTSQIGSPLTREAIQLAGRSAVQCAAEQTDTTQTTIAGNTLRGSVAAIHLAHASGDPGAVVEVAISCNRMLGAGDGVASDESERATPGVALHHNDLNGTSAGVRNLGAASIDATANWWGAADGPSGAGAGSGDPVQGAVEFSGFLAAAAAIDADGDGLSLCAGDCGPLDALVFPGATESCDGLDNDCNAAIDDPPAPGPVLDLQLARLAGGAARITWSTTPSATRYDVIAGRLSALLATAGDFAPATERCITATEGTGAIDGGGNSSGGTWYLVRGANCGGNGSYDQTTPDQTQSRDASIAASPIACP